MEKEEKKRERTMPAEEESGFDIMEWLMHFAAHWYLFIIGSYRDWETDRKSVV